LPVAMLVCLPTIGARLLILALTLATRSIAVFGDLQVLGAVPLETSVDIDGLIGVMVPTLTCLPVAIWQLIRAGNSARLPRELPAEVGSAAR